MSFILSLILLVLFIGLFALLTILGFIRRILGLGRKKNSSEGYRTQYENPQSNEKPKIFDKNEGEYVDYEEVKE